MLHNNQTGLSFGSPTNTNNVLENIEAQTNHIENLKNQVIQPKKILLGAPGNQPLESAIFLPPNDTYGIYRHTGGKPLGVVGEQFEPMNLQLFLDAILQSFLMSGINVDLTKLTYTEYCGGSKVVLRLPFKKRELKTKLVGDIIETYFDFRTAFDGSQKSIGAFWINRLFCTNGATRSEKAVDMTKKNTKRNTAKIMYFPNEIIKVAESIEQYGDNLDKAAQIPVTQLEIDAFFKSITGMNPKEYADMTTRSRNIFDSIQQSIATEFQTTGANLFSLLQGFTRYTTHELAKGSHEKMLYAGAAKLSEKAHDIIFAELN